VEIKVSSPGYVAVVYNTTYTVLYLSISYPCSWQVARPARRGAFVAITKTSKCCCAERKKLKRDLYEYWYTFIRKKAPLLC
jgi:hypothetical protein